MSSAISLTRNQMALQAPHVNITTVILIYMILSPSNVITIYYELLVVIITILTKQYNIMCTHVHNNLASLSQ